MPTPSASTIGARRGDAGGKRASTDGVQGLSLEAADGAGAMSERSGGVRKGGLSQKEELRKAALGKAPDDQNEDDILEGIPVFCDDGAGTRTHATLRVSHSRARLPCCGRPTSGVCCFHTCRTGKNCAENVVWGAG